MDWIVVAPALTGALILLIIPGFLILWPLHLGAIPTVALAGVLGVLSVGVAGVLAGALATPWATWQLLIPWTVGALVTWLAARPLLRHRGVEPPLNPLLLAAWAAAGLMAALAAFWEVPSADRVSQTYDNVFHMSATAAILDGRSPSSFTLRTLIETDRSAGFYPAGWHTSVATVVQATGAEPAIAVNALWIAVVVGVWIPGIVWLAQVLIPDHPPRMVAAVAIPLSVAFAAMPYALLSWGTLYPTFLATALLPAALAVPIVAARRVRSTKGASRRAALVLGAVGMVAAVCAIVFAQPRVLASWAVVLIPAAGASFWMLCRDGWRRGGSQRRRVVWLATVASFGLVVGASLAFFYAVRVLGLFARPLEDRLGGPQAVATQSVWAGLWQVLSQSWPTGVGGAVVFAAVPVAVAVVIGIIAAVRSRGTRWVVVSYAVMAVLYAAAAGSDGVLSKLATAIWYKDRYRLSSVVAMLAVVLATRGVLTAVRRVQRRRDVTDRSTARATVATSWLLAASSVLILAATGITASVATAFRLPASEAGTAVVSAEQIGFFTGLAAAVPAGQRVLGDPWDGSAWTQLFGDREPVFPHVNGQWDADRLLLAQRLQDIDTDPTICDALRRLDVEFVVYSSHELSGGDPAGNLFPGPHLAVDAGLFTEVASAGETSLYRIDQCRVG
ncbi:DUF6541 family protein [Microbacterium sp. LWH3-1.2]|uniref:DUF6541 family protein n=1 Tax=Microbacterium sp. LWH3-1.2 TaxID=3135256 RepID=UPI00343E0BE9